MPIPSSAQGIIQDGHRGIAAAIQHGEAVTDIRVSADAADPAPESAVAKLAPPPAQADAEPEQQQP